jgi:Alginate export
MRIAITVAFILIAGIAKGQTKLEVSGDLRARAEYRHGFGTLAAKDQRPAFFVDQRSRLIAHYVASRYAVKLSLQDVRVWGNQSQMVREDGALTAMHEAWGEIFFTQKISARLGRQEIAMDDHRIFGNVDWAMQARSHDALVLKYLKSRFEVQAGLAFNQDKPQLATTYYTIANNYKTFQYLWLHHNDDSFSSSVLFLNNGKQGGTIDEYKTYYSQTIGLRSTYAKKRIKPTIAYYHQLGNEADDTTNINASYINVDLKYQLFSSFSVNAGCELLSGNDRKPSKANRAFNPFYGTNHKFNGLMDYFYVGNHINNVGLRDYYFHLNYQGKTFSPALQFHFFQSDGLVTDPEDGSIMSRSLGMEFDLVLQYKFNEEIKFDGGYSQFIQTNTLEVLKGVDAGSMNNWAWLMVTIKPVFYKTPDPSKTP